MLPCQNQCASYHEGCHKTCAYWSAFQEHQKAQRQAKKAYLKYYGQLCADTLRQLTAEHGSPGPEFMVLHGLSFPALSGRAACWRR